MIGVDFAYPNATHSPAALKAAGVSFVIRYISTPGNTKNLTPAEYAGLRWFFDVYLGFELYQLRPYDGAAAGALDVASAEAQADALFYPLDHPIFYACDTDAETVGQLALVAQYFRAIKAGAKRPVGIYAGTTVLDSPTIRPSFDVGWQAMAWAHEPLSPNAHIKQGGVLLGCDRNELIKPFLRSKVSTVFNPPLILEPIVSSMKDPDGGFILLAASGAIYNFEGSQFYGGANGKPYFTNRKAAYLDLPNDKEKAAGRKYVIVATNVVPSGERYAFPE